MKDSSFIIGPNVEVYHADSTNHYYGIGNHIERKNFTNLDLMDCRSKDLYSRNEHIFYKNRKELSEAIVNPSL